jgi:tryptophan-rich sensory protein
MNDRIWAGIGKIGAFLGVVISLILGVLRLYDRIAGPSLEAATEMVQPVPSKSIKRLVENEIEHQRIIADIEKRRSSGEPADLTLKSVEADLKKATLPKDDFLAASLEQFSPRQVLELTVWNHGGDVARSVEIMMPGSGTAQISELGSLQTETTLQWTHSVQLGDLPPGATLIVRIWTDNPFQILLSSEPVLVYAKGTGTVHRWRQFFGWVADLATWYSLQSKFSKTGECVVFTLSVGLAIHWLERRGYVRFHRQTSP